MNRSIFALGAAAAVLVLAVVALGLYVNRPTPGIGGQPSPTMASSPSAQPEVSPTAEAASPEPSVARPTSTPAAGLAGGPFSLEPDGLFSNEDSRISLTVTIPAPGWTFHSNYAFLEKGAEVDNLPEAAVLFWAFPGEGFYVPADPCRATSTRPGTPATTADEIAAALAAQATRDGDEPVDVTVGGYEGKFITLHVPDDAVFGECETGEFVQYVTAQDNFVRNAQSPGQIEELWVLDVDGTIVIIDATSRPDTLAALVEEMRGIVESTRFEASSPTFAPTASPTSLARGTFIFPWDDRTVDIDAAGTGSSVVGTMSVSNNTSSFTVDLQCTRTTEDGLILIGGDVTDSTLTDYAPEGSRTAIVFQRGSPVRAIFWFQMTEPRAASCLAFIEEISIRSGDSGLQAITGSVELAP